MHNNNNGYPSSTRAWMTVAILMLAYVLSFVDRQILNLLVEPIRRDLDITDTHMSLLMGFSFAVFYTICGVPIGRLADRKSRRGIIAIGVLVWSLMTALCGTPKPFWHFLVFRIGVGVGEAALSPSAYSLIADSFPPKLRGTAMSVYSMGIYIGSGLAFLLGGLVVKFASAQGDVELPVLGMVRPWQLIFLVLGAAGVLFAAVLLLIREPSRKGVGAGVEVPLSEVAGYIRQNRRTVLCHNFGFACLAFAAYGSSAWIPTFFIRTYGWSASDVGVLYGSVVAVAGSIGIIAGGRLSDLLHRRGYRDAPLRVGIISAALTLPLNLAYLAGTGELAVLCGAVLGAGLGFLWFNAPPASIFMGDTGSLALGGMLGATAVAVKHEIVLAVIGGLFVLEAVSVIVQVTSFKLTGKRVFRMAPLHHHFEQKGWTEIGRAHV